MLKKEEIDQLYYDLDREFFSYPSKGAIKEMMLYLNGVRDALSEDREFMNKRVKEMADILDLYKKRKEIFKFLF